MDPQIGFDMPSAVVNAINKTDQIEVHHQIFSLNSSCCSAFLRDWKSVFQRNWKTSSLPTLALYAIHFGNPNLPYTGQKRCFCQHICRHVCHCVSSVISVSISTIRSVSSLCCSCTSISDYIVFKWQQCVSIWCTLYWNLISFTYMCSSGCLKNIYNRNQNEPQDPFQMISYDPV